MNAKAAEKERKEIKTLQYQCEECSTEFCLLDNKVVCPSCGSQDLSHMVIIYKEDDPEIEGMMTRADLHAGD